MVVVPVQMNCAKSVMIVLLRGHNSQPSQPMAGLMVEWHQWISVFFISMFVWLVDAPHYFVKEQIVKVIIRLGARWRSHPPVVPRLGPLSTN